MVNLIESLLLSEEVDFEAQKLEPHEPQHKNVQFERPEDSGKLSPPARLRHGLKASELQIPVSQKNGLQGKRAVVDVLVLLHIGEHLTGTFEVLDDLSLIYGLQVDSVIFSILLGEDDFEVGFTGELFEEKGPHLNDVFLHVSELAEVEQPLVVAEMPPENEFVGKFELLHEDDGVFQFVDGELRVQIFHQKTSLSL